MLTPQAIKDQEFQIKFRGYDAIEVKAYLELLAEDYFELTEQNRVQAEEIESLMAQMESLQRDKESLAGEVKASQENADGIESEIEEGYKRKDREIEDLVAQVRNIETEKKATVEANTQHLERVSELEAQLTGGKDESVEDRAEIEKLRVRAEVLEEQNAELKQAGVDFKTTIVAAQTFADNLRENSEAEAEKLLEDARLEVDNFKAEAEAELSRLPIEIEALHHRKREVREELRGTLQTYIDGLDVFPEESLPPKEDDLSELFESIEIPDIEGVDAEIDSDNVS